MGCCSSSDPELLHQLARSPFFFLDDDNNKASHLHSLSKRFTQRKYSANQVLWKRGDSDATFNVIIEGEVRLEYKQDKQMVFISKRNTECFGLDSLEHEINRVNRMEYACIAVTDLTVYQLSLVELNFYWDSHKICHEKFIASAILPISSYLQSIDVFSSINTQNASLLSSMFRWKKVEKNEILFEEGTLGEAFYIVAKGSVAVVVTIENPEMNTMKLNTSAEDDSNEFILGGAQLNMLDPEKLQTIRDMQLEEDDTKEQSSYNKVKEDIKAEEDNENTRIVYEFKSGDYFGEVSLVIKIPRTATIKATENTTLLQLRKSDFQKFIPHNNAIKLQLEQVAHERIAQSFRRYQIPLFNAVPLDMFHVLSKLSQIKYYKTGEIICDPESKERGLYVIAHGNVGVYVTKQRINNDNNKKEKNKTLETLAKSTSDESSPREKLSQRNLLQHDGNRQSTKRMSEQLSNDIAAAAHKKKEKRISKHLLPSNVYLLANMSQRDKLNRELIRLSFISSKALHQNEEILSEDEELIDESEFEEKGSSEESEIEPTPTATPADDGIITEPMSLKPKQIKQYPRTPQPSTKRALGIDSLKVNVSSTKAVIDDEHNNNSNNTPSFHSRFHTHAGFQTPSDDNNASDRNKTHNNIYKKKGKKKTNRRNSENALFRMKITSPAVEKQQIYTRNEKFVRIADLMIPDENVDKLRSISRRGSHVSNVGLYGDKQVSFKDRDASMSSLHNKKHCGSPSIIKIDPSDPSAYENLDFAKSIHQRWKTNQSDGNLLVSNHMTPNASVDNNMAYVNNQLHEMIKEQEKEHEMNLLKDNLNNNTKKENNEIKQENEEFVERIDEKGMKLRDFKSADGSIIYTEIEVSVLGTGNFFGETSLMDEAEENEDDFEDLNKTPTSTQSVAAEIIEMPDIPVINTAMSSKPSVLDIISNNNNNGASSLHAAAPSGSYRAKSNKKKIDIDNKSKRKTYRGSHTTFRCLSGCVIYSITKQSIDEFFRIVPSARPWFDIMLSKYNVSLDTVLHIPRAARYFTLFLESEYAQENIHYVLSVNEYKDAYDESDSVSQMEMAQIICNHFISDQGQQQINVSYQQRKYILNHILKGEIDKFIFDSTQKAIYTLLQRDCFPRFKQSHFFHEFLNEAENLALLTKEQYENQIKEEENITQENRKHSKLIISKSATSVVRNYNIDPSKSINETQAFDAYDDGDDDDNNILKQRAKTFT